MDQTTQALNYWWNRCSELERLLKKYEKKFKTDNAFDTLKHLIENYEKGKYDEQKK